MLTLKKFPREMFNSLSKEVKTYTKEEEKALLLLNSKLLCCILSKIYFKKLYGVWVVYYIFLLHVFPVGLVLIEN